MKTKILILLALSLTACVTNPNGSQTITIGKTSVTIPATDVAAANNIVAAAITTAATGVTSQLLTTGSVNAKTLASAELSGVAATAQGYVGAIIPPTVLSSSTSIQTISNTVAQALTTTTITQGLVNALNAQAAKIAPATP